LLIENYNIEETEELVSVYNFQVEDFHTYQVGKNGVLMHNANYPKDPNLIQELKDNNIKFNENKIMRMTRDADGKVVWLEEGNSNLDINIFLKNMQEILRTKEVVQSKYLIYREDRYIYLNIMVK
jgi:hypothetical protein